MAKIALMAGKGKLPLLWAREAVKKGHDIYAFPVVEEETIDLEEIVEAVYSIGLGTLGKLIDLLKQHKIEKAVMLGKVEKANLFNDLELDQRTSSLLAGLNNLNDDSILEAVVNELEREGIEILKQYTYLDELLPDPGVLTVREPDDTLYRDMEFGFNMAREIGRLDIGQTVIVKDRAVLAVEAIEGTDETIKRGGCLGQSGIVMAKVSKPCQDFRFDIPTIGLKTLDNLIIVKARGLVIEAGKTFIVEREQFIEKANEANITVVAKA